MTWMEIYYLIIAAFSFVWVFYKFYELWKKKQGRK